MSAHQIMLTFMQFVLPISIVFTLNLVAVLAIFPVDYLMYGTTVNKKQKIGVFFGFLGVVMTVNGELIMDIINQN
jgi:drug/metabolite transporter (DMT)-like permease